MSFTSLKDSFTHALPLANGRDARLVVRRSGAPSPYGIAMHPLIRRLSLASLALFALAAAPVFAGGGKAYKKDIVGVAGGDPQFSTLVSALKAADLVETLKGQGPYTVFAPTNAAFAALPPGTLDDLMKPANKEQLRSVLLYHVVPGKVMAAQAMKLDRATTANGKTLRLDSSSGALRINDAARVTKADVPASNGVIHVIDAVLLPPKE